ncbi:Mediator of RNA polymerase II transcription subunit 7 [Erysiphe neolycopersici]|uniref:Mediator of RNA polymerase II transcription subunit 7 n=1 Tax=Erysiphe neolycopersici TaxID=212602 RepID=A0A420HZZ6_9PEZI|nr:Mediator of RNA polymerase II transcription subunit 7 [Erysiphe neolycopersici]
MEEQPQTNAIAASLPEPPSFYQHFTPANIQWLNTLYSSQTGKKDAHNFNTPPLRLPDLPLELRFLQPPEPPTELKGSFRCFGDVYYIKEELPTLQDMGVEQVYTPPSTPPSSESHSQPTQAHHDRAFILKRLAKSLLLNFLELVSIMATNSSHWAEKVQDIRTLSVNFHHLLNEYRPHQARESLILMMREQLDHRRAEISGVEECREKVERILERLSKIEFPEDIESISNSETEIEEDIYRALDKEFE